MNSAIIEITLAIVGGLLSFLGQSAIGRYLKRDDRSAEVLLRKGGQEETAPAGEGLGPEAVAARLAAIAAVAPQVALIEAWRVIESAAQLVALHRNMTVDVDRIVPEEVLSQQRIATGPTLARLSELHRTRNRLVHNLGAQSELDLPTVIRDVVSIVESPEVQAATGAAVQPKRPT